MLAEAALAVEQLLEPQVAFSSAPGTAAAEVASAIEVQPTIPGLDTPLIPENDLVPAGAMAFENVKL